MATDESQIRSILEAILESGVSAEEACRDNPSMLPEVRERMDRVRALESHIDAVLPAGNAPGGPGQGMPPLVAKLPNIDGYLVEGVVGSGGMGVVYRARHLRLNRVVAIKMLLSGGYAGPRELERFKREAESIAGLCHPNIVQVFDAGECDGHPYFVMEFMTGGTLAGRLAGNPQPAIQAATDVRILALAVQTAHDAGIVHRDLKPANVLLTGDGTMKIADFGLAVRSPQGVPLPTFAGARMGTPSYMAPEQARGEPAAFGPLVDVYALGAILYELITGRPPFRGENAAETERQVISDEPVPPSRLSPRTPQDLQTICLKCLHKGPNHRYATAAELAEDLDRFSRGAPIRARPITSLERATKWIRRRPAAAGLIAALSATVLIVVGGGVWLQKIESDRRTEQAIRQGSARDAIAAALSIADVSRRSGRWVEAQHDLESAAARLEDAKSPELKLRLDAAAADVAIARDLEQIRLSYPEPNLSGYDYKSAAVAYASVFSRLGIGPETSNDSAAAIVRDSEICDNVLVGLDNAAFVASRVGYHNEVNRLLAIARSAKPDPWQDRFRESHTWRNRDALLALVAEARSHGYSAPAHQLVIMGVLLSGLGANPQTVELLREAQYRNPSDFWVNLELGNALDRAQRYPESFQFYRAALAIHPDNFVTWSMLGGKMWLHGSKEESIGPLRKAVELNSHFVHGWQLLAVAMTDPGKSAELEKVLNDALAANPGDASLLDLRDKTIWGRPRDIAGRADWSGAASAYRECIERQRSEDSEIWFEYAAVQLLADNEAGYREACDHMLEKGESGVMRKYLVLRAFTLSSADPQKMVRAAKLGSAELQDWPAAYWSLAEQGALLSRTGLSEQAISILERSIQANSQPGAAIIDWAWLALAHAQLGNSAPANEWLRKITSWIEEHGHTLPNDPKVIHLHNWLEAQVLRREVDRKLKTVQ